MLRGVRGFQMIQQAHAVVESNLCELGCVHDANFLYTDDFLDVSAVDLCVLPSLTCQSRSACLTFGVLSKLQSQRWVEGRACNSKTWAGLLAEGAGTIVSHGGMCRQICSAQPLYCWLNCAWEALGRRRISLGTA